MRINYFIKSSLFLLFFCFVFIGQESIQAQVKKKKESQNAAEKNKCVNSGQSKFIVKCQPRYFLGESPIITISITNTNRSAQTVKEAEYQKISLEMTGIFEDDSNQQTKKLVYDGSWDIPKEPTRAPRPDETTEWLAIQKREPKYISLLSGESTNLELNLAKIFRSYLGVGIYKLTVKSEEGQKVDKEFEVYFDNEKSVPVLAKMLRSESNDVTERNWAVYNLSKFSRTKFVALLEELLKSGTQKQRDFASGSLADLKAGRL